MIAGSPIAGSPIAAIIQSDGAVAGNAATSQAQTTAGTGTVADPPVTGVTATSQAQTIAGTGTAVPPVVTGTAATSQAQTVAGTGTFIALVTGTAATSQAQRAAGTGTFIALVTGVAATSQAQTVAGTGAFNSGVTGVAATSQAQTTAGVGGFTPIASDIVSGAVPLWNPYAKTGETEEQKKTRRLAQGIIARAQKPKADVEKLAKQAKRVSEALQNDAKRLEAEAEYLRNQLMLGAAVRSMLMQAQNDALATRQLEQRMITAQIQAEFARQQIEELDVVFMTVMLAAMD